MASMAFNSAYSLLCLKALHMHWVSDLLDAAIAGRGDNYAAFMCQQLNAKNIELSEKVDLEKKNGKSI